MYEVKHLSQEEMEALRAEFPFANIMEYQVREDGMSLSYHSTIEEADVEELKWKGRDIVREIINDQIPVLIEELERKATWYGLDSAEVLNMLRSSI